MDFEKVINTADILSTKSLKSGKWDTEAFIVAALVKLLKGSDDIVPESNIDEMTDTSKDLFVSYMRERTDYNLTMYLAQIRRIISELYNDSSQNHKKIIAEYIVKLQNLL